MAGTNGVFMINQDVKQRVHIYINACTTGCVTVCQAEAYHTEFASAILWEHHPICELEAANAMVSLKHWPSQL